MIGELPATPPLIRGSETVPADPGSAVEIPAPTPQARPTDKDGGPLGVLSTCRWCYGMHPGACPKLKVVEWHPDGQISRVVLKERPELEAATIYPYEDDSELDVIRRALTAIKEGSVSLERAQELAGTLLEMLAPEVSA